MKHLQPFSPRTLLLTLLVQGCAVGLDEPAGDAVEDAFDPAAKDDEGFVPIEDDQPAPGSNRPDGPLQTSLTADAGGRDAGTPVEAHRPSPVDAGMVRPDVTPAADVVVVSPDVVREDAAFLADNRRPDVPGPTTVDAGPPTRWLNVTLDPAAQRECPGRWALVLWGPDGAEVPMLPPAGERLHVQVPWSWVGVLRFGARCPAVDPARWRDWSTWLGRPLRAAGVQQVTLTALDGVDRDLTDRSLVCAPPAVGDLHPDWPLSYYAVGEVALEPALEGRCNAR